jgi:hypothetical protein
MAKDYEYKDSTPIDEPVHKGSKVQEPGSAIRVDGKPVKEMPPVLVNKLENRYMEKRGALEEAKKSKVNAMGDTYAKGGSASSRADGCCVKGKTKGTIVMCGGGMSK